MKAVILAGGFGTRLRPLTYTQPKPMLQIVGKPVIEHIIEYLRSHGFFDIILTTNYLRDQVVNHLGYGEKYGVNIFYPFEEDPLGTAGSVKNISHLLNETFLVIQGDNITDFDLNALVRFHRQKGGLATMMVHTVPDPEQYGVVVADDSGMVRLFQEKPPQNECKSNMINTGVYVLEPEVLDYVPLNRKFDFSRDLFPMLAERQMLYACPAEGFWTDIGQPSGFNKAKMHLLKNAEYKLSDSATILGELGENVMLGEGVYVGRNTVIHGPTSIGENTLIEENCVIGPNSCLGKNLVIKEGTRILDSTLFDGTEVGRHSHLNDTLIGEECCMGYHSIIWPNTLLGSKCNLGLSVNVEEGSRIWPNVRISHGSNVSGDIRIFWQTRDVKYNPSWSLRKLSVDEAFYFNKQEKNSIRHTGYVAKSLYDFNEVLSRVESNSIQFHLRHDINDFSEWARKIIGDPVLAQSLDRIKIGSNTYETDSIRQDMLVETATRLNQLKNLL
ncbi:MAG: DUF5752 family protein [Candidatus Altiarchaeota archaeon]